MADTPRAEGGGACEPVPSRRTPSAQMAARGLRSAAELAADKPCGTRVRYYAGCRCRACRRANTAYESERARARRRGEHNHLVSAEQARAHLAVLAAAGVGRKTIADSATVPVSTIIKVITGERRKLRFQTARRLLAVTPAAAADGARIDSAPTWVLLDELRAWGYTQARIASELIGHPVRGLQMVRGRRVTVRVADQVRRVHERLRCVPAAPTLALLRELSEEGFHRDRVARRLDDAAQQRGWEAPETTPRNGLVRYRTAVLVHELWRELVEPDLEPAGAAVAHG